MSPLRRVAAAVLLLLVLAPAARAAGAADVGAVDRAGLRAWVSQAASRGAVAVVNYWATWCGPCREEVPQLMGLRAQYPESQVEFLGVSLDEDQRSLDAFLRKLPLNYPVGRGGEEVARMFRVATIPKLLVYDRAGKLVHVREGLTPGDEVRRMVDALLAK